MGTLLNEYQKTSKVKRNYLFRLEKLLQVSPIRATFLFLVSDRKRKGTGTIHISTLPNFLPLLSIKHVYE
jgi:hypothetical protein